MGSHGLLGSICELPISLALLMSQPVHAQVSLTIKKNPIYPQQNATELAQYANKMYLIDDNFLVLADQLMRLTRVRYRLHAYGAGAFVTLSPPIIAA